MKILKFDIQLDVQFDVQIDVQMDVQMDIQLDIHLDIHLDIQLDIQLDVQLDVQLDIHFDTIFWHPIGYPNGCPNGCPIGYPIWHPIGNPFAYLGWLFSEIIKKNLKHLIFCCGAINARSGLLEVVEYVLYNNTISTYQLYHCNIFKMRSIILNKVAEFYLLCWPLILPQRTGTFWPEFN